MTRKGHIQTIQTHPRHREEETQNTKSHMTSKEMQLKMVTVSLDKSHTLAFSLHVVSLLQ